MIGAIRHLYPTAQPLTDFILQDDGDGPRIVFWRASLGPAPLALEIAAANAAIQASRLDAVKKGFIIEVDDHIGAIFMRFQRFQLEYEEREKAAQTYKDAGYTGEEDPSISVYAVNSALSYSQAVDNVLSQAAILRGAIKPLGALRMRKFEIVTAATESDATSIRDDIVYQSNEIAKTL